MKKIRIIAILLTLLTIFTACGKDGVKLPKEDVQKDKIELSFWHSMGGAGGEGIKEMIERFNQSQDEIRVVEQFQGDYDEAINKLKSATKGNAGPDIAQIYDIGTEYMINSGHALTMQDFIDQDDFDLGLLEDNILAYYKVKGDLYSMPFNSSTPLLYYNQDLMDELGVDKIPEDINEIIQLSKGFEEESKSGLALASYGWFFEQWMSKQGLDYANMGNGRESSATEVDFNKNGGGIRVARAWKDMVDSGNVKNYPTTADARSAFIAGQSAMTLQSTASLVGILDEVGDKFKVGTAFYPSIDKQDQGGVSIGGGSLWILDNSSDERAKAAWEFVKFMVSPEEQVFWHKTTGYFPINKLSYDIAEMKTHLEENPQFKTAIDQLRETSSDYVGALLPIFPEARKIIESNIEDMLINNKNPEEMIENSSKEINKALEKYNKSNTK